MASDLESDADQIEKMRELGDACLVLPGLLRCTARQLCILNASANLPIEVAAGACRTVFEVNIHTRLVTTSPDRMREVQSQAGYDEIELIEGFLRLEDKQTSESVSRLRKRKADIEEILKRHGLERPKDRKTRINIRDDAKAAGMQEEYSALYKFYSKYVHGSSWLIYRPDSHRDIPEFRGAFLIKTQLYAADTWQRIRQYALREPSSASSQGQ